jgi:hydroxymethylglutaryl-CoA lyase/(R)-citramalyl-CoA lyase
MDGAEQVLESITPENGITYAGLVLNDKGYARFRTTMLNEVRLVISCSESFSNANVNASVSEAILMAERITKLARQDGRRVSIALAVAFGCPFEGAIAPSGVIRLAERVAAMRPDELVLADTIGVAVPQQVRELATVLTDLDVPIGVHFHDTRNTGIANALEALERGVQLFDASCGGTGGCPFAPGATGNVATEDLAYVFERQGIDTGIDLDLLIEVARWLSTVLDAPLGGHLHRSGPGLLRPRR